MTALFDGHLATFGVFGLVALGLAKLAFSVVIYRGWRARRLRIEVRG